MLCLPVRSTRIAVVGIDLWKSAGGVATYQSFGGGDFVHECEVFADVSVSVLPQDDPPQPHSEVGSVDDGHEHDHEPYEQEDALVEQIDGQHTLHRHWLHRSHLANLKQDKM